jgi:hypothetical protein
MAHGVWSYTSLTGMADNLVIKRPTPLIKTLFREGKVHNATLIEKNRITGSVAMALLTDPYGEAKIIGSRSLTKITLAPFCIKQKMLYTGKHLEEVKLALPSYIIGSASPKMILEDQIMEDLAELRQRVEQRKEYFAALMLTDGSISYSDAGFVYTINYGRSTSLATTASTSWDGSSSQPSKDFQTCIDLIERLGTDISQPVAYLGLNVVNALENNTNFLTQLDNRRMNMGDYSPGTRSEGMRFLGRHKDIELYSYTATYDGTNRNLNADKMVMTTKSNDFHIDYGLCRDVTPGVDAQVKYLSKSWVQEDPSGRWIYLETNPLLWCNNINNTVCMTCIY